MFPPLNQDLTSSIVLRSIDIIKSHPYLYYAFSLRSVFLQTFMEHLLNTRPGGSLWEDALIGQPLLSRELPV